MCLYLLSFAQLINFLKVEFEKYKLSLSECSLCGVVVGEDPPAGPGWDKAGLIETVTSRHTNQTISSKTINILVLFQKTDQNE